MRGKSVWDFGSGWTGEVNRSLGWCWKNSAHGSRVGCQWTVSFSKYNCQWSVARNRADDTVHYIKDNYTPILGEGVMQFRRIVTYAVVASTSNSFEKAKEVVAPLNLDLRAQITYSRSPEMPDPLTLHPLTDFKPSCCLILSTTFTV
jgi:hypothetical protein